MKNIFLVSTFMTHLISLFSSHFKRHLILIGFAVILLCQFEPSFAAESANSITFIDAIQGFLKIVASLLGVLTTLVALFLNPEWTSGTAFGLQNHLKEIWILVSNVVYFIFALILIVIAFMNIIGKEGDTYQLKSALPKLIVGILIVPFSWFFVQFVVSISAVLTVGVLTLPYDTFKEQDFFTNVNSTFKICTKPIIDLGSVDINKGGAESKKGFYECGEGGEKTVDEILNSTDGGIKNGVFGIISIYTYGILGMEGMDQLTSEQVSTTEGAIKAVLDLGVKGIFDLLFVIIYSLLMLALFLALFVRGIRLWIYMMLAPTFGLLYFFGDDASGNESFSIKQFISLALVPVYVCAALSFGLVFLFVASNGIGEEITVGEGGTEILELAGLSLTIKGFQGKPIDRLMKTTQGALSTLIVEMFGLVILWIAVMAALKQSSITAAIVQPIAQFGESVGQLAMKAPSYAPIIPMPGGAQSAASLRSAGESFTGVVAGDHSTRGSKFGLDTANRLGLGGSPELNDYKLAMSSHTSVGKDSTPEARSAALTSALTKIDRDKLAIDRASQQEFIKYLKQIFGDEKITPEIESYVNKANSSNLEQQLSRMFQTIGDTTINQRVFGSSAPTETQLKSILTTKTIPDDDDIPETPVSATATVNNNNFAKVEISPEQYKSFVSSGTISDDILKSIAQKMKDSDKLSDNEISIYADSTQAKKIEELLEALKPGR